MKTLVLDADHSAHEPPEARGLERDNVRMMVSPGLDTPIHATFRALPDYLVPGDLVVVNTSGTIPAAIDAVLENGERFVLHVSTELPGGLWMVEPRQLIAGGATEPLALPANALRIRIAGGTELDLLRPAPGSARLWIAAVVGNDVLTAQLHADGRPIRYRYVDRDWPIEAYQTVFADAPGSAEMPSAARPFSDALVTALIRRGIALAPLTLHTGVSSLEGHEMPYPERFAVPAATAAAVNATHAAGGHVVAVGTTVVRALETAADARGTVHPASGWTDTVITPQRGVHAVDGLVTGWHEPEASHLAMLEAIAGRDALDLAYAEAYGTGYLWHEFGDSHLLLPYAGGR
ncbi:MAG: S-adenosylmethionine:tRNA ribosyltransferase-isomerase [Acidimicrobiales bacterium]